MSMASDDFVPTQWWQTGVIYQVYPRSFQDTDGDGVGDLQGIIARLDYLVMLGVDAIWISPIYPSPMADFGYDVSDYTGIDAVFGTMDDFDALLRAAHGRNLRVILDFVPNHTSDQHPWFLESRSSRENPKRDWYLWHDAAPAGDDWKPAKERVPNNWMSHFGGPSWTWDEKTQQFYLHSFLPQQPDLNWRNPEVRTAMYNAMRFWLDRGVDGFRMDVLWLLIKDEFYRNNPPNPHFTDAQHDVRRVLPVHNADQPETHEIVAEMRKLMDAYPDTIARDEGAGARPGRSNRVLIGEIYLPLEELVRYYGMPAIAPSPEDAGADGGVQASHTDTPHLGGADLPFNFHLIQTRWGASEIASIIQEYEALLPKGAWPNYVLGNHDQSRLATRVGPLQARAAAMLLLTLRGTPTMYYGDELGMHDVPIAPDEVQDPAEMREPGKGRGRDPERSPMLWLDTPNAGFTTADAAPWLPLEKDWPTRNAAAEVRDPKSFLSLYRRLLALRRQHDTLHAGAIADVAADGGVLRYRRVALEDGESTDFLVLLNLGAEVATVTAPPGTVVLTTVLDGDGARVGSEDGAHAAIVIEAGEGLLIALD
jgi:alpha-glucosidase